MESPRKRILVVSSNFSPEDSGIAVYSTDLAREVLSGDFDVTIITGLPHYPWWRVPAEYSHLTAGKKDIDGITTIRVNHAVPSNPGAIGRARLEFTFWQKGRSELFKFKKREFDLVIGIVPTVASGLIARSASRYFAIPGIIIFQDITSLGALQSGIPGGHFLYKVVKYLEKRASKWATKVIVVSETMKAPVIKLTDSPEKVVLIHNYSVAKATATPKRLSRDDLKLPKDLFLIMHTGNIGYKQDLLNVVEAAKLLENHSEIKFMIFGHGNQEEVIGMSILDRTNIELRPFVDASEYSSLLAASDLLLVNERSSLREMSLPSKLTSYLISGKPVLAAVSSESATSRFLGDAALLVPPGNPQALADGILMLKNDLLLREELAERGKKFADDHLSADSGRSKYLGVVRELLVTNQR